MPDVAAIVARTAELVADRTISIPRILGRAVVRPGHGVHGHAGKPWRYLLIPDGAVLQNATLPWLDQQYVQRAAPDGHHGNSGAEVDTRRPASAQT